MDISFLFEKYKKFKREMRYQQYFHNNIIVDDIISIKLWVMLTSVLRVLVKNPVKESFYRKKKKKTNVLTAFFISHKSDVKTFFN